MKKTGKNRNGLVVLLILLVSTFTGFSQNDLNFKEEMIKSGEKYVVPEEYKTSASDYASFLKSKLLNSDASGNSIFTNPKELGLSVIGGRVRAALVDKTNQISLVAPSGGGLWKFNATTNDEFTPIDDFGSFMAITDIAQNPFSANHILIGTGDRLHGIVGNGLFESRDGGNSFSKINSTDPGINSDFRYIRFVKFSPVDKNTIYLATDYKLFKSSDSGSSWTEVFYNRKSAIHSLDFLAGESVILGVDKIGILISSNGNSGSFNLVSNDLPNDSEASSNLIDGVVAATHAANRNISYAFFTGASNDVYKTIDNGVSWTLLAKPAFYVSQPWFCLTIGVHPVNPDIVVLGSVAWAYTSDGGASWQQGAGLEVDFHSVHFHDSDPNVAYIGYDQGLGRVDFGKYADVWAWNGSEYVIESQPEQLEIGKNERFNTSQVYYGDYFPKEYGDGYIQGQQDGGCFGKVDVTANRIVVGDGGSVFVNKQNPLKAFASTQRGNLKSTVAAIPPAYNYSAIGDFYNNHPNWITQFAGNNADGNQIYISTNTSINRTTDGGTTFDSIASHSLNSVKIAVQNAVDPIVYALGYNSSGGKLDLITINNAATNPSITISNNILSNYNGGADHIEIDPNDENTIFITHNAGYAFKVSDLNSGTLNVKLLNGDAEDVVFNTVIGIKGKPEMLIAGTNIGVFYSTNSGINWLLSNELPYAQITDLKLRESDNRLFVFTYGRGSWAVTVNTEPTQIYTVEAISLPASGGTISGTGSFKNNSTATVVAEHASGYQFANWTEGGVVVSTSASYSFKATKSRNLVANFNYGQSLEFNSGWNIFSAVLHPIEPDIQSIFQPLINNSSMVVIQDEQGNSFENSASGEGWQNNIGSFAPSEGYKIKVSLEDSLNVLGTLVTYPFPIALKKGWNIIAYPQLAVFNGMDVIQQLVNRGSLNKVQDESGRSIEDWGVFGGWQNNIGNFFPGEGYKIKVNSEDTIWIYESYQKSTLMEAGTAATKYFHPEYLGAGVDHMNLNLVELQPSYLQAGDEIAVFDGNICVGAAAITQKNLTDQTVSLIASAKDNLGMNGFTEGNSLILKLWKTDQNKVFNLVPEIISGTPDFKKHETTFARADFGLTGFDDEIEFTDAELKCYPNPFNKIVKVEISLKNETELSLEVFNELGQIVKTLTAKKLLPGGTHQFSWDGRNSSSAEVSSGIYYLRMKTENSISNHKIVLSN